MYCNNALSEFPFLTRHCPRPSTQTGTLLYIRRAVILAIYADHPAAAKCALSGSGCVQCFVGRADMHLAQTPEEMVPRTRTNMAYKKRKWLLKSTSGAKKAKVNAYKEAAAAGVNLDVDNGMWGKHDDEAWVFGPDPSKDNVYLNCPQVTLHGMDEGLTAKLNFGALHYAIDVLQQSHPKLKVTAICRRIDRLVLLNANSHHAANKNVELGGRDAFKRFKHGVTGYILGERRIDGGWHIAIARQLSLCLCTFKELKSESKHKIARAYELLFQVHHGLRCPLPRAELALYAARINDLLAAMVELCQPYNNSACRSIKYHWPRHWWETRLQLGCAAAEKSLERKLGQSQKRNFRFTNKQEATCEVRPRRFDAH